MWMNAIVNDGVSLMNNVLAFTYNEDKHFLDAKSEGLVQLRNNKNSSFFSFLKLMLLTILL